MTSTRYQLVIDTDQPIDINLLKDPDDFVISLDIHQRSNSAILLLNTLDGEKLVLKNLITAETNSIQTNGLIQVCFLSDKYIVANDNHKLTLFNRLLQKLTSFTLNKPVFGLMNEGVILLTNMDNRCIDIIDADDPTKKNSPALNFDRLVHDSKVKVQNIHSIFTLSDYEAVIVSSSTNALHLSFCHLTADKKLSLSNLYNICVPKLLDDPYNETKADFNLLPNDELIFRINYRLQVQIEPSSTVDDTEMEIDMAYSEISHTLIFKTDNHSKAWQFSSEKAVKSAFKRITLPPPFSVVDSFSEEKGWRMAIVDTTTQEVLPETAIEAEPIYPMCPEAKELSYVENRKTNSNYYYLFHRLKYTPIKTIINEAREEKLKLNEMAEGWIEAPIDILNIINDYCLPLSFRLSRVTDNLFQPLKEIKVEISTETTHPLPAVKN